MALNEKQKLFIDGFCQAIEEGLKQRAALTFAKQQAGYAVGTGYRDIINDDMAQEILAYANRRMVMGIPTAIDNLESVMETPTQDGAKILLDAIGMWLDRSGVIKKESKEVVIKAPTGVVFLPPKAELDAE